MSDVKIFDILTSIDQHDITKITDDHFSKAFVPLLTMRWMTGMSDPVQLYVINEQVNPYVFSLHKHKTLLWRLMCASLQHKNRYVWIKKNQTGENNHHIQLLCEYYKCTEREAHRYKQLMDSDDYVEMAEVLGWDADQIKKLNK